MLQYLCSHLNRNFRNTTFSKQEFSKQGFFETGFSEAGLFETGIFDTSFIYLCFYSKKMKEGKNIKERFDESKERYGCLEESIRTYIEESWIKKR